jgi:hypothetical protein
MQELVIVNNLFYNRQIVAGSRFIHLGSGVRNNNEPTKNSIVGNYFFDTGDRSSAKCVHLRPDLNKASKVHTEGNAWNLIEPQLAADQWTELVLANGHTKAATSAAQPPVWNTCLEAQPWSSVLESVRKRAGPRPADRIAFVSMLTDELGGAPTHGFPTSLADIQGELSGLPENKRKFVTPSDPHSVESNGRTRLENHLIQLASEIE